MNTIAANWSNRQILPIDPVNWPEGTPLRVETVNFDDDEEGMDFEIRAAKVHWKFNPESIEEWCRAVDNLDPVIFTDEERKRRDDAVAVSEAINIEAVRKQMEYLERSAGMFP
jgi:hypothetical protein